jgi:hypothetical protein
VALSLIPFSVGLGRPPGVTRHRGSMEPGLSSAFFPLILSLSKDAAAQPSGRGDIGERTC